MIYKIPIYVELVVEGDFNPLELNAAIDKFVRPALFKTVNDHGFLPQSSDSLLDKLARQVARAAKLEKVKIQLVPPSKILEKLVPHMVKKIVI